ncbi:hypothetical protein LPUS_04542 [Lasallia pustulata]|uniref:Uncharacterized protein n=1 Tax=Lasallia pustulata TaxID=136370 RepID=A0A1W5CWR0_9LECA|nr:hypothetical protein LPUS_04542 [Lasallia pustulata]
MALLNVPIPTRPSSCPGVQEQVTQRSPGNYLLQSPTYPTPAAEQLAYQHSSTEISEGVDALSQQEPFLAVREEDTHLQMCRDMTHWCSAPSLPTFVGHLDQGRELIEYHDGTNSITILGEVFGQGQKHLRRLVRILLKNPDLPHAKHGELSGLDDADTDHSIIY